MQLHHTVLVLVIALAGCGSTPEQWQQLFQEANQISGPQRNYLTNPVALPQPVQMSQPDFGADGTEYRTVMVNTPSGFVYKRCKMLNGQVAACF